MMILHPQLQMPFINHKGHVASARPGTEHHRISLETSVGSGARGGFPPVRYCEGEVVVGLQAGAHPHSQHHACSLCEAKLRGGNYSLCGQEPGGLPGGGHGQHQTGPVRSGQSSGSGRLNCRDQGNLEVGTV